MKHRAIIVIIGLAILAVGLPASGNVFWRWRAGAGRAVFTAMPGWRSVYQSNIRVNGGQGRLEILHCADSLSDVILKLKNAFPAVRPDTVFRSSESAGFGLVQTGDTVSRILAMSLGAPAQTVVFLLTQSPDEYAQSLTPPPTHLLDSAPVYPNSVAQTFLEDEEASMQLEISAAPGRPDAIWAFFDSAFAKDGFHRMQDAGGRGQTEAGLAIFQKGMRICCVLVQPSPQGHESTITVLHKQLKID